MSELQAAKLSPLRLAGTEDALLAAQSMGGAAMVMVEGAVAGAKNPAHPRKLSAIEAGGA